MIQNAFDGMISIANRCYQAQGHALYDYSFNGYSFL